MTTIGYEIAEDESQSFSCEHPSDQVGLDRARLLASVDGDFELLQKVILLFLKNYPKLVTELNGAIRNADGKGVARLAHTLKGSGGLFLNKKALELTHRLELAGLDGNLNEADDALRRLSQEMARLEPVLSTLQI